MILDKLVLKNGNNEILAYFYGAKGNYQNVSQVTGVSEYQPQSDGPWMPTRLHEVIGSGQAVRVLVSGGPNEPGQAKLIVRSDNLQAALGGGQNGLIGKTIKVGRRNLTIRNVRIPRKSRLV